MTDAELQSLIRAHSEEHTGDIRDPWEFAQAVIKAARATPADQEPLGWTWERRYSNGGYTRRFCATEEEARELAKDGAALACPDLVYPFFVSATPANQEPAYKRFLSICSEELIRSSLTSLPLKIEFGRGRGMTPEQVDQWMRDTRRMFRAAVEKRLEARQETKGDGND